MTTLDIDGLIGEFERRVELLEKLLELASRQRRAVEQKKTSRLDRLIDRREYVMRQWRELEEAMSAELDTAKNAQPSDEQKSRLRVLIERSEELGAAIRREDELVAQAAGARNEAVAAEIKTLRTGRETLRAYARDPGTGGAAGIDRNG